MKIRKTKRYYYLVETNKPVWPRHLADDLLNTKSRIADNLVSVTDIQNDQHMYGRTYTLAGHVWPAPQG